MNFLKDKDVTLRLVCFTWTRIVVRYPSLSELFWPPPSWLCPDSYPYPCEEEDELIDSSSQTETSSEDEEIAADEFICESDEDCIDLFPATRAPLEISENSSMKKFQGVDVRSDFFPYLRKIWKMHDFFEDHAVRSNGLLTWALESLAKMMIILQNNMGKGKGKSPLNESQAEYLTSTLVDLQSMQFRLDWLVPIVEKALSRYKSKEPGDIVMELQVERYRLLGKLHQVEGKLADQKRVAAQSQCSVRH
ncbi:uncharacterized protein [Spinacia oleracea]|uniref:Uncharacterized protein n=1 Tax=Spinacia oleracea TaxID=3562 RepID=A0ABM3QSK1_SPIOL|nr:uncharacterized protein LOC110805054 [Spinacia oleracea]